MLNKIFTIIICCYNSGKRLERVIDNVLAQQDFDKLVKEIIIINNNSNDNTATIIERCIQKADNIYTVFESSVGLSNARRTGVNACSSDWIVFLDDDNFLIDRWLIETAEYIQENPRVGAFNGVVIPKLTFQPTEEELLRLSTSLKVLACTHPCKQKIKTSPFSPFRNPIGAGMIIRTVPLKQLLKEGWLSSVGRTKDNLTSGEDGEMALYVKRNGYGFGFCTKAIIEHEIPKFRLQDEYLNKIWYEIGRGVCIVVKEQKWSWFKNIGYCIILELRLKKYKVNPNPYYHYYYNRYIEGYKNEWKL